MRAVGIEATHKENYLQRRSLSGVPRSAYPTRQFPLTIEHTVLWADRDKTATGRKFESKTSRKEARGKTLSYSTESAEVRRGLNASRMDEWEEWRRFQTGHLTREDRTPLNQVTGDDDRRKPDAIRSAVEQF